MLSAQQAFIEANYSDEHVDYMDPESDNGRILDASSRYHSPEIHNHQSGICTCIQWKYISTVELPLPLPCIITLYLGKMP